MKERLGNIYSPLGHIFGFFIFLIIIILLWSIGINNVNSGDLGSVEIGIVMCFFAGILALFIESAYIIVIMEDIKSHIDKKKRIKSRSAYLDKNFHIYD